MVVNYFHLIGVEAVNLVEPNDIAYDVLGTVDLSLVIVHVLFFVVVEGSGEYLFTKLGYPGF